MQRSSLAALVLLIVLCEGVGILGSLFTAGQIDTWYATLARPFFSPPNGIFGPVWTLLYALMGTAAWFVWKDHGVTEKKRTHALRIFLFQLFLNGIWTPIFFGLHEIGVAFLIILVLLVAIVFTTALFWKIRPLAGWLMVPYILWVSFASVLNGALWLLN